MFQTYLSKNLQEGEDVVRVVRRSPGSFAAGGLLGVVFVLAPFFFLFPLFRLGAFGVGGFFLLLIVGALLAVRACLRYAFTALCITNRRMIDIDQRGLFDRVVSEIAYAGIRDVSVSVKGIRQTVLGLGTLRIGMLGDGADFELRDIRDAEQIRELITSQSSVTKTPLDGSAPV